MEYPICLQFTHESTLLMPLELQLLAVGTYTVAFSRHRNCRSNQGKLSTPTSCQHNLPVFFVFYPVQTGNISLEHLFPPISINDFQEKKELRNSRLCVWPPHDCMILGRVEHCFDLTKPGVLLETFVS